MAAQGETGSGGGPLAVRVVIVEDRPSDAELMVLSLRSHDIAPDWQRVDTAPALEAALDTGPDLVLSDWSLPRFSGLEALAVVRARDPDLPFIVVSGSIGEEAAIDALHRGADDYVLKDRMARLGPAVRRALDARRLRAERERAHRELAFQAFVLANVRDAVVVADLEGRISYWNDGAAATFGWTADEILGQPISMISEAATAEIAAALADIAAGSLFSGVWSARHRDGHAVWVETSARILTDLQGAPVGFLSVSRDVTEQRRVALERERLAAAIEQAHETVVITDPDGRIVYVNPAFERSTGYGRDEVLGANPRIVKSGVHPPAFYEAMWSALTAGEAWVAEFTNRRRDGTLYQERAHLSPIRGPDGAIVNYVAVKHDVTRERQLEAAALEAARDRALIADTLARLPSGGSAEETAEAICRQVVSLAPLTAVAFLHFEHDGRAMPLAFVTATGSAAPRWRLPLDRSEHIRGRATEGPWIEAWTPRVSHPYNQLLADLGAVALAEAPARHGGELVGLLVAISAEPDAVERLTGVLPALAEFADLAGVILGPSIAERTRSGRLHAQVSSVIYEERFRPVFQPIVDLETTEVVGFEGLTRFDGDERPDRVFADAWSVGLGPDLEIATLNAIIAAATALPPGRWLNVNMSPRLFGARPDVAGVLATVDRPLVIEITEHEAVADYDAVRAAIRALGPDVRLAVDDAGAGAANFAHIVGLRPDFVKLDIGLVRGIHRDMGRQALMVGMRHFARTAGCRLIAEGIEVTSEADTLAGLGAEFGQGYLYGRPAPAAAWVPGASAPAPEDAPG